MSRGAGYEFRRGDIVRWPDGTVTLVGHVNRSSGVCDCCPYGERDVCDAVEVLANLFDAGEHVDLWLRLIEREEMDPVTCEPRCPVGSSQ